MSAAAESAPGDLPGVPRDLLHRTGNVVLRIRGNHLAAGHILDGDYLIVRTGEPEDGDMVVALDGPVALVARYHPKEGGHVRLVDSVGGEHRFGPDEIDIRYLLVAVIRKF